MLDVPAGVSTVRRGEKPNFCAEIGGALGQLFQALGRRVRRLGGAESPNYTHLLLLQVVAGAPHQILLAGPWENDQHRAQSGLERGLEVGDGSECGGKYGRGEEGSGACRS